MINKRSVCRNYISRNMRQECFFVNPVLLETSYMDYQTAQYSLVVGLSLLSNIIALAY